MNSELKRIWLHRVFVAGAVLCISVGSAVVLGAGVVTSIILALAVWLIYYARQETRKASRTNDVLRGMKLVFDNSVLGIVIADAQTDELLLVNSAFASMHGYTKEEMNTANLKNVFSEDDRDLLAERANRAHEYGQLEYESMHVRQDGTLFPVQTNVATIYNQKGKPQYRTASVRDITERKKAEKLNVSFEVQLRSRQRLEAIGTLAGGVAHEINNPLTGIMNYAQLITDQLAPGSSLREYSICIIDEADRVASIVKSLLTFSTMDRESHSPARIEDIVNETICLVGPSLLRDGIELLVDVPENLPEIDCRSQQIQQVLTCLLTNAREALNTLYPESAPDKIIELKARSVETGSRHWLRVTVEDHATGITDDVRDRLFEPFFSTKNRAEGAGLGLSISHGIVQEHGGNLRIDSEPGQPTRFSFELPVSDRAADDKTRRGCK